MTPPPPPTTSASPLSSASSSWWCRLYLWLTADPPREAPLSAALAYAFRTAVIAGISMLVVHAFLHLLFPSFEALPSPLAVVANMLTAALTVVLWHPSVCLAKK